MHLLKNEKETFCGIPVEKENSTTDKKKNTCALCTILSLSLEELNKLISSILNFKEKDE